MIKSLGRMLAKSRHRDPKDHTAWQRTHQCAAVACTSTQHDACQWIAISVVKANA